MLGDLPDQRLPVGIGHPVARLDLLVCLDHRLEGGLRLPATSAGPVAVGGVEQCPLRLVDLLEQAGILAKVVAVHTLNVTAAQQSGKRL